MPTLGHQGATLVYPYGENKTLMKPRIRINFVDFWDDFVPETSLFYQLLSEKYEIELSATPDYLFCSAFGDEHLKHDCVKIFYTGENQCPDFNLYDYAIGFERMTLGDRYFRLPIYYLYANDFAAMQAKHVIENLDGKGDFCSFVYSNNNASPHREQFFDKLNEYKTISSGGRHRNNVGGPVADKLQFQLTHKFSIAFENSSYPGYCTEKLVQSFAARTIPIYWGDPQVDESFNEGAFIEKKSNLCSDIGIFALDKSLAERRSRGKTADLWFSVFIQTEFPICLLANLSFL